MKRFVRNLANVIIILTVLQSCVKENECDSKDYAAPVIDLVNPEDSDIEVTRDVMMEVEFSVQAEGGLNTVTVTDDYMYESPITAFIKGETESTYTYSTYVYDNMKMKFMVYDLCNNASESITVEVRVIEAP